MPSRRQQQMQVKIARDVSNTVLHHEIGTTINGSSTPAVILHQLRTLQGLHRVII